MNYNAEQVVNGLMKYTDSEVMSKLPTSGKWIVGTAVNLASNRINNTVEMLRDNAIVKMLGLVDDNGDIDVDALIESMKSSADKYGKLSVDVPMVGTLTFSAADIDRLRTYMM